MSRMPGPPQAAPPGLISNADLVTATACPDCASELWFVPVRILLPGNESTLFGTYIAHDHSCPAFAAAAAQQRGNQQ